MDHSEGAPSYAQPSGYATDSLTLPDIPAALTRLVDAYRYAQQLKRDIWDFALELPALESTGCGRSDLRWLLCKGQALHGVERTATGDSKRKFEIGLNLSIQAESCFVLTAKGYRWAVEELSRTRSLNLRQQADPPSPVWDGENHEFRLGAQLIKRFRLPSPNQERVLMAFQEEGWPSRIDDPLPPRSDIDPKRRLHDTIKSLNRNQKQPLVRFHGDGTGQGVRWGVPSVT